MGEKKGKEGTLTRLSTTRKEKRKKPRLAGKRRISGRRATARRSILLPIRKKKERRSTSLGKKNRGGQARSHKKGEVRIARSFFCDAKCITKERDRIPQVVSSFSRKGGEGGGGRSCLKKKSGRPRILISSEERRKKGEDLFPYFLSGAGEGREVSGPRIERKIPKPRSVRKGEKGMKEKKGFFGKRKGACFPNGRGKGGRGTHLPFLTSREETGKKNAFESANREEDPISFS